MASEEIDIEQLIKSLENLRNYGSDPEACRGLSPIQRHQVVGTKLISFGISPTVGESESVTALYEMFAEETSLEERRQLLNSTTDFIEQNQGKGISALRIFFAIDPDEGIRSEAVVNYSVLHTHDDDEDPFTGPRKVLRFIEKNASKGTNIAAAFHGLLNLGDYRLLNHLKTTWAKLPEETQMQVTKYPPIYAFHSIFEFYLDQLESGCSDQLFGSICALLTKIPRRALDTESGVFDIERSFPSYSSEEPIEVLRHWSLKEYFELIRPRLERIAINEADPKIVPTVIDILEQTVTGDKS